MMLKSPQGYYNMVLMDMQMPVLDGCGSTFSFRESEHPDAKKLPIYAMTANVFKHDIQKALDAGMNGHIAKPVKFTTIINTIAQVVL